MARLEYLIGIKTNEFVLLGADKTEFAHGMICVAQGE
jgi:hypothetical protein